MLGAPGQQQGLGILAIAYRTQGQVLARFQAVAAQQLINQHRRQVALKGHHQFLTPEVSKALDRRITADQPDDPPHRDVQQAHRQAASGHQSRQIDRYRAVVDLVVGQQHAQLVRVLPQTELDAFGVRLERPAFDHVQQRETDHSARAGQAQDLLLGLRCWREQRCTSG